MVMNACSNELEQHGELCIRYWRSRLPNHEPLGRLQDELNMAVWVTLGRWMTGREDFKATWVAFRHPQPPPEQSEEHTSELQSLMRISYAVFCLKKKKK